MASEAKTIIDSLRGIAQDLLVPEIRALQVEMKAMKTEMQLRDEKLYAELRFRDEKTEQRFERLAEKLDFAIDIR